MLSKDQMMNAAGLSELDTAVVSLRIVVTN